MSVLRCAFLGRFGLMVRGTLIAASEAVRAVLFVGRRGHGAKRPVPQAEGRGLYGELRPVAAAAQREPRGSRALKPRAPGAAQARGGGGDSVRRGRQEQRESQLSVTA